jgi:hypothetical protein
MITNKLAGAVALFVLQNSKNNDNEAIPFCVRVNQRSDRLLTGRAGAATRSTSGVRPLRLPACVGLSWACAKQGGRHTADRLLARNKQRVSLQVFDLLLTPQGPESNRIDIDIYHVCRVNIICAPYCPNISLALPL